MKKCSYADVVAEAPKVLRFWYPSTMFFIGGCCLDNDYVGAPVYDQLELVQR